MLTVAEPVGFGLIVVAAYSMHEVAGLVLAGIGLIFWAYQNGGE